MSLHRWPPAVVPDELGVVVHGPVVLGRADGIVAALRCVFAHTGGLRLVFVLRATGVRAEAANRQTSGSHRTPLDEIGPGSSSTPTLHVEVGGQSGGADPSQATGSGSDDAFDLDADYWIDVVPADARLTLTIAWPQAGLPASRTELVLAGLDTYRERVLPLL